MFADEIRAQNMIESITMLIKLPYTIYSEVRSLYNSINSYSVYGNDVYCVY